MANLTSAGAREGVVVEEFVAHVKMKMFEIYSTIYPTFKYTKSTVSHKTR